MAEQELKEKLAKAPDDPSSDLGFGRVLSSQRELRLINRDGSFNVQRRGRGLRSFLAYSNLVSTTWSRFFLFVAVAYLTLNGFFALLYDACGPGGLVSTLNIGINSPFLKAFFFSIHTSATIGYGTIVPVGVLTNILVALESEGDAAKLEQLGKQLAMHIAASNPRRGARARPKKVCEPKRPVQVSSMTSRILWPWTSTRRRISGIGRLCISIVLTGEAR